MSTEARMVWLSMLEVPALSSISWRFIDSPFKALVAIGWVILAIMTMSQMLRPRDKPRQFGLPVVSYLIPYVGSAFEYGRDPIGFLNRCKEKHGNVFTFIMLGRRFTVTLGASGTHFVMSGQSNAISAAAAQTALTTPVFGKGVIYDAPMDKFVEQKKFITSVMDSERFSIYVPLIEAELLRVFQDDASFVSGSIDILNVLSEIVLRSSIAALHGPEVMAHMLGEYRSVFQDLCAGFTPLHWIYHSLPLPSYRKRDIAHAKMRQMYLDIIRDRRMAVKSDLRSDLLASLMNQQYRNGTPVSDTEIAHLMIATLVVGHQTSASAGAWILLHLAANSTISDLLYDEQKENYMDAAGHWRPLEYHGLLKLPILRSVIRETFRLNPPVTTSVRLVLEDLVLPTSIGVDSAGDPLIVPKGNFIMTSNGVSQLDSSTWRDPLTWNPMRWLNFDETSAAAFQASYQPFGTGKHRCSGELFAMLELSVLVSTFIRHWRLSLPGKLPESDYSRVHIAPKSSRVLVQSRGNPRRDDSE